MLLNYSALFTAEIVFGSKASFCLGEDGIEKHFVFVHCPKSFITISIYVKTFVSFTLTL